MGLALDITGAVVLAKGLLVTPALISQLARSYHDWNALDAVDRVGNRLDGEFGVAMLATGFVLQAVGYVLVLAEVPTDVGSGRLAVAGVLALAASGVAVVLYLLLRDRRQKALRGRGQEAPAKKRCPRTDRPR